MNRIRTTLVALAFATALTFAPPAPARSAVVPTSPAVIASMTELSWEWDWDGFKKYWRAWMRKGSGVVGTVGIVVLIGVLIVMSARKKT